MYRSVLWCLATDMHLKLLDSAVSDAHFLTRGVFESNTAHSQSAAVLCMLYNIGCNLIHSLYGAVPLSNVPVRLHMLLWSHISMLMCFLATKPHSTVGLLLPSECLCVMILLTVFDGVRLIGFKCKANAYFIGHAAHSLFVFYHFLFLFIITKGWHCGAEAFLLIG